MNRIQVTAIAATACAAAVTFAAPASADPVTDYAALVAPAVCSTLDDYPTFAGIQGVSQGIVNDTSGALTYYDAGTVIALSVEYVCPRHMGLLRRFVSVYATTPVQV